MMFQNPHSPASGGGSKLETSQVVFVHLKFQNTPCGDQSVLTPSKSAQQSTNQSYDGAQNQPYPSSNNV
jgi:hypothetical protein